MSSANIPETKPTCANATWCDAASDVALTNPSLPAASPQSTLWRISTMDCASEEGEIRRALEPIAGIRSLSFQLRARTLAIDADDAALEPALAAIRKAGFFPQPVTENTHQSNAAHDLDDHSHDGHDHHDHEHGSEPGSGWSEVRRYVAALAFAVAAEALSYFAPDVMLWKITGMVLAAVAIGLAGLSTYGKGFGALRHGRLNINALMTVAVPP